MLELEPRSEMSFMSQASVFFSGLRMSPRSTLVGKHSRSSAAKIEDKNISNEKFVLTRFWEIKANIYKEEFDGSDRDIIPDNDCSLFVDDIQDQCED